MLLKMEKKFGNKKLMPNDDQITNLPRQKKLWHRGFSRKKADNLEDLAQKYKIGILSDSKILGMGDKSLSTMVNMVKGIGPCSGHMFVIFSLHRPNVLPINDVGEERCLVSL
ncbi:hypothetical protein RJ641_012653 [Dillenia turbinata]|uniref:Uncharacterized protein n=1 Tax=Dillenia turbinata TaxID=194707 RepID=A0AAN8V1Y6_9MAGN